MSLKHAVLVLLEAEPASGYDLLKRFNERMGYFWNASHQQIYKQLKTMHEAGDIDCQEEVQAGRPDRKVYSITPQGHGELLTWLAKPVKPNKINDSLLVKMYAGHLRDSDVILEEVRDHRQIHETMLQTFQAMEAEYQALVPEEQLPFKLPYLTLRRGILGEQSWLAWADEVEQALAGVAEQV
ncbi:PadR family transcriptional regulator [Maricurvus nonylphenolicus]|uniref:PadR family transcriptional regulator n=1 Tax=Maricurvus nonylphenolicus TaxID=1008307 RepID=UPI0036F3A5DB